MQKHNTQGTYLDAGRYFVCGVCKKYWCSGGKHCTSQDCGCPEFFTVEMLIEKRIEYTLCGTCQKDELDWLARQDPDRKPRLRLEAPDDDGA